MLPAFHHSSHSFPAFLEKPFAFEQQNQVAIVETLFEGTAQGG
jgi:hypothetical protein